MTVTTILLVLAVGWLAYANGANDNFKGVATLFGSGTTSYRRAMWWAMATTLAGSLTAVLFGGALIKAFSGKGMVGPEALADPGFLLSVSAGAAATVLLATRLGFPISTTHSIIGGLIGAGFLAPGRVDYSLLGARLLLPLLLVPLVAVAVTFVLYVLLSRVRLALGITRETCLCVGEEVHVMAVESPALAGMQTDGGSVVLPSLHGGTEARLVGTPRSGPDVPVTGRLSLAVDSEARCEERYTGTVMGVRAQALLDALHYLSAGAVGFARGIQDTAKIVGLLLGAQLLGVTVGRSLFLGVALVGGVMAAGGVLGARRVAETLGKKITDMDHGQGFTANLVTSGLVIGTALCGMPVSTTHCSVGSILGIGLVSRTSRWKTIGRVLLAWVITLPVAAMLGGGVYLLAR